MNNEINNNNQLNINKTYESNESNNNVNNYNNETNNMISNEVNMNDNSLKSIDKKKIIIIIAIAIIVIIALIIGIILFKKTSSSSNNNLSLEDSLTKSSSFFLKNDKDLYALFDKDGKKLTDYNIKSTGSFINNSVKVTNKDGKYGIISSNGKMIVDYGRFEYIITEGPFYKCRDKESVYYLLDTEGKTLLKDNDDINISSYIGEHTFALVYDKKEYKVYNYKGKIIGTFPLAEDKKVESPRVNSEDNYISIFYNKTNYIFDVIKSKLVLSFQDNEHFCVSQVNEENNDELILHTCTSWYGKIEQELYKYVKNGSIIYTKKANDYQRLYFEGKNVIYTDSGSKKYVLDEKGNTALELKRNAEYVDYKNYIMKIEGNFNGSELYVNGKHKQKFDCSSIPNAYTKYGIYLLEYCKGYGDGNKIYIKQNGSRITDKSYKYAYQFDKNGYAVVSENGMDYYLINLKGKKVSDTYVRNSTANVINLVEESNKLYLGTNKDDTESIFEANGKVLLTGKKIYTEESNGIIYAIVEDNEKYTVYDVEKNKKIITVDEKPKTYPNYFIIEKDSKEQYYSYTTGKMFYEK